MRWPAKHLPFLLALLAQRTEGQLDLPGRPKPREKDPAAELVPPKPRGDSTPQGTANLLDLPGKDAAGGAPVPALEEGVTTPEGRARFVFAELDKSREL